MENPVRIHVNLSAKEFEVEGSEQFVKEYLDKLENLLLVVTDANASKSEVSESTDNLKLQSQMEKTEIPETFGEYLHLFPKNITNVDRVLIAGYFLQSKFEDKSFTTTKANELLLEQGIKIANPADCVSKNKNTKRVFVVKKGEFRVSSDGIDYINSLLEKPGKSS